MLALVVLAACAQPSTTPTAATSQPSAEVAMPRVVLPDGFVVDVELAIDPETRAQGLMYRDRLAENAGMLFFFEESSVQSFWMKNTMIPLDIIWIDDGRRVVHVKENVPPCRSDPCPSYDPGVPAKYVLELGAGVARKHRVAEGAVLRFEGLEKVRLP